MIDSYSAPRDYWKTMWICVLFIVGAAVFTWCPHRMETWHGLDIRIAEWVNGWIGHSRGWDWLLAALNHDKLAQPFGVATLLAIWVAFAWGRREHDMGRLLGHLLMTAGAVILALGIVYALTENLEEYLNVRGPHYELPELLRLEDFNPDWAVDVRDKESVPSRAGTIYFTVFWMALFRSRALALALLAPVALFGFSAAAVGREWTSAVVAGALLGGAVASFLTRTPLAGFPRWLERASMDWVESLLTFWTPSRPRMGPAPATAREAFQDFDSRIVSAPRQRARDTVLDDLIEANIAPFFVAPSGEPPEISLGPPGEERNRRQSRYVRFLSGEGLGGCVVVKGAWKRLAWFRKANRVVRYRNAANVHALLQTRGVEIPRLLFRCDGGRGFSRMQFHLIAEDLVSGRPLRPGNVEDCRAAARTLAKMHAIVRGDAGGVWQGVVPRERYPHRQILPRVRRYVRLIEREAPTAEISFFGERTGGWFWSRTVDLLDLGAPFSLCHGDVSERNVLIEDSKATLLDFTSSLFGLAGFDLIKAYANWGGGDAEATRAFAESYFESVPEEHWKWFSSGFDMFAAMLALKFLYQHFRTGGDKYGNFSSRRLAEAASRSMQGTFEPPASVGDSVDRFLKLFFGDASAQ